MDKSIHYTQVMSNFDSAYNSSPNIVHHHHPPPPSTIYVPMTSSSSFQNRSISPSLTSSNPKFNLDFYQPNNYHSESIDYPSPSSSVIIHHHPVYSRSPSPPPPPPSQPSQAISKLRQINDELCQTLAQCELPSSRSQPLPSHRHIHHYPVPHEIYHSRSPSIRDVSSSSSSVESEPVRKKSNARIKYKMHIPRRQNSASKLDQILLSTSDAYSNNYATTYDIYPTQDQGFIKKARNYPDNQRPWLADTSPIRRNSYSETSTYRTPRAPYYDDIPLTPKSRLASGKIRPRSSSVKSRLYKSVDFSSNAGPVWRPNGSIRPSKFIGSHGPPTRPKRPPPEPMWNPGGTATKTKHVRAFDPGSKSSPPKIHEPTWNPAGTAIKTKHIRAFDPVHKSLPPKIHEPTWQPSSINISKKPPKYFEPTLKPELIEPIRREAGPLLKSKPINDKIRVRSADPKLKTRIANAESKVKSAWEPTTTTDINERKPSIPRPTKKITTTMPSKSKTRVIEAESKVKSAWEPTTTTDINQPKPKPPIPRPTKKITTTMPSKSKARIVEAESKVKSVWDPTTTTIPSKPKVKSVPSQPIVPVKKLPSALPTATSTGRSTLNGVPDKPLFQSTPREQSIADENEDSVNDLFENGSEISEPPKKQVIPHPPPRVEKTPTKLPRTSVPELDKNIKPTVKDDDHQTPSPVSKIDNNDDEEEKTLNNENIKPSRILPERKKTPSPKPDNRDDISSVGEDIPNENNQDDTHEDNEHSFEINKSHDSTTKVPTKPPKKDDMDSSINFSQTSPKVNNKTPPHQNELSTGESPEQSPIRSIRKNQQLPTTPPPQATKTTEYDDFFD